eukprot:CAMPEP_0118640246 /NCGR_PEP_ID=MMETSP0785-20121206/4650_1 /TAXON_ID=91992 /ORGANISM="Bolidomonas pacifica, Strain CCMP 1866" /LENGTH=333 /DNA_ID=CAMNT_0006531619 /DNA_START=235 /DNA_END=1232 /DNA_ORIENTATION=+
MKAIVRLKKLGDVLNTFTSASTSTSLLTIRMDLKARGIRVHDAGGYLENDSGQPEKTETLTGTPQPAPALPTAAVPTDPNAMLVDTPVDTPTVSPTPADTNPHFFTIPSEAMSDLPSYNKETITPLRRHMLSRLTKRLLRCSSLLSSTPATDEYANPPDWYMCPILDPQSRKSIVQYDPWRGAQLIPGAFELPPNSSLFAPLTTYDYLSHLNYCTTFINDQKRDFLRPPPSHHLRDIAIYEKLHKTAVDPFVHDNLLSDYITILLDRHEGIKVQHRKKRPAAEDVEGTKIFDEEAKELDRIIRKLKDSLEKGNMTRNQHKDAQVELVRKHMEG